MSEIPVEARPAASVMVVRQMAELEVLLVERPERGFFGGLMVFPGGAVDACDREVEADAHVDIEYRVAALRETAEEVGFVITATGHAPARSLRGTDLLREFGDGRQLGVDRLSLVSRWVTPRVAPTRYDTRFYLVGIDDDPEVILDTTELVSHIWLTPRQALQNVAAGRLSMILPTISHLRWLDRRRDVADAERAALGTDGLTIIEPVTAGGEFVVRYRGDDEH